jgi:hypothetical protein
MDLISLGKKRVLSVIDFQTLHTTEEYSNKYIAQLSPIRQKYPELQGTLSGKIYDDVSFFSKNMLFGRFTDESNVKPVVFPAVNEYLNEYIALMDRSIPNRDEKFMNEVKERQSAYDTYSAIKDPAVGLFEAYFGKEWSHSFVHDFLFSLSKTVVKQDLLTTTTTITNTNNNLNSNSANVNHNSKEYTQPVHNFRIDVNSGEVSIGKKI